VAELQERVLRSGFQEIQRKQIAAALDAAAVRIEDRTKFFVSLEARVPNSVDRVQTLMKLCSGGFFTQGELMTKARRVLLSFIGKPGFLMAYIRQMEREKRATVDRDAVLSELAATLASVGVAPDDALRALAA
jgi:hypothetical protein